MAVFQANSGPQNLTCKTATGDNSENPSPVTPALLRPGGEKIKIFQNFA